MPTGRQRQGQRHRPAGFRQAPWYILRDCGASGNGTALILAVIWAAVQGAGPHKTCTLTKSEIAERAGFRSASTIRYHLAKLEKIGVIKRHGAHKNRTIELLVTPPPDGNEWGITIPASILNDQRLNHTQKILASTLLTFNKANTNWITGHMGISKWSFFHNLKPARAKRREILSGAYKLITQSTTQKLVAKPTPTYLSPEKRIQKSNDIVGNISCTVQGIVQHDVQDDYNHSDYNTVHSPGESAQVCENRQGTGEVGFRHLLENQRCSGGRRPPIAGQTISQKITQKQPATILVGSENPQIDAQENEMYLAENDFARRCLKSPMRKIRPPKKPVKVGAATAVELEEYVFPLTHFRRNRPGTKAYIKSARVVSALKRPGGLSNILDDDTIELIAKVMFEDRKIPYETTRYILTKRFDDPDERIELYKRISYLLSPAYEGGDENRKISLGDAVFNRYFYSYIVHAWAKPPRIRHIPKNPEEMPIAIASAVGLVRDEFSDNQENPAALVENVKVLNDFYNRNVDQFLQGLGYTDFTFERFLLEFLSSPTIQHRRVADTSVIIRPDSRYFREWYEHFEVVARRQSPRAAEWQKVLKAQDEYYESLERALAWFAETGDIDFITEHFGSDIAMEVQQRAAFA